MRGKIFPSPAAALHDVAAGSTVLVGGFGLCGIPEASILALRDLGRGGLTVVSNNAGTTHHGLVHLLRAGLVRKMVSSYVGENEIFEQQMLSGALEVDLVPQGTLAERLRAGGAGIPAFYTATGVGTPVAEGKPTAVFEGRTYLLERAITGDFGLVHAWKGDTEGNLIYRKTARNFNPLVAAAARVTVAQVEHLVPAGDLDPDQIHTPAIYVHRVVHVPGVVKQIERRVVRPR